MDINETFEVHTHSNQYKEHLKNYAKLEEQQPLDTNAGPHADPRYVAQMTLDFFAVVWKTISIML